jgi:glutathione synthase/RimK-type ligase-like ATP-grasp enzyme
LQPFVTWRANQPVADFSAVFLDSPLAGSTPLTYLAGRAGYDRHFLCVLPNAAVDVGVVRDKADVVFNMICNADDGAEILPVALDLADRLGRPVINHPRLIMNTDRAAIAARLAGIPGCVVPKTVRLSGSVLAAADGGVEGFALPVLVRLAGKHGGDDFERFDDWAGVAGFVASRPDEMFYVTEYADYRSADGLYRKYRVIFIDGAVLPYHLAIHDDWKVHHFRTDMANQDWMRREEEDFLADPDRVLGPAQMAALAAIGRATGLDYGGADFGLDREGQIVVFEANASMLVHDEKDAVFAYKNPYIARIKQAFDTMLVRRLAGGTG